VPVLSVVPHRPSDVLLVAAAIASPPIAALAMTKYSGAALSADAIKLSAKQAASMPLPAHREAWQLAADLFATAQEATTAEARIESLQRYGNAACKAYGMQASAKRAVLDWWLGRIGAADGSEASDE
jgi:hypothetical protein